MGSVESHSADDNATVSCSVHIKAAKMGSVESHSAYDNATVSCSMHIKATKMGSVESHSAYDNATVSRSVLASTEEGDTEEYTEEEEGDRRQCMLSYLPCLLLSQFLRANSIRSPTGREISSGKINPGSSIFLSPHSLKSVAQVREWWWDVPSHEADLFIH